MGSGLEGLAELAHRTPVAVRVEDRDVKALTGDDLANATDWFLVGGFGSPGVGKTRMAMTMVEDHVELRAAEDEWIVKMFQHNPEQMQKLLAAPEKVRRSYLRAAHMVIYLDFDLKGAQPLFKMQTVNKSLNKCFHYMPCSDWEDAYANMKKGMAMLKEHEKRWGRMGCWFIIDNADKAWAHCRTDFVYGVTGTDMNTMMADIRMKHPGKNSEAKKVQAEAINEKMDYGVINPMHNEEWMDRMVGSGYHMMILSPPKDRIIVIGEIGGKKIKEKVIELGGAKNNRHAMHYIWELYTSEDGHTYFAKLAKTRYTGKKGDVVTNPHWHKLRMQMERLEKEQLATKAIRHAKFDYFDELPDLDNLPIVDEQPATTFLDNIEITPPMSDDPLGQLPAIPGLDDIEIDDEPSGLAALANTGYDIVVEKFEKAVKDNPVKIPDLSHVFDDVEIDAKDDLLDVQVKVSNANNEYSWSGVCQTCGKKKDNVSTGSASCYECDHPGGSIVVDLTLTDNPPDPNAIITEVKEVDLDDLDIDSDLADGTDEPLLPRATQILDDPEPSPDEAPRPHENDFLSESVIASAKDKGRGKYHFWTDCPRLKRIKPGNRLTIDYEDQQMEPELMGKRSACPVCESMREEYLNPEGGGVVESQSNGPPDIGSSDENNLDDIEIPDF